MIRVRVEYIGGLAALARTRKDTVTLEDGATVSDLVHCLSDRDANLKKVLMVGRGAGYEGLLVLVNGRLVTVEDSERTKLSSYDMVTFTPPLVGG